MHPDVVEITDAMLELMVAEAEENKEAEQRMKSERRRSGSSRMRRVS